MTTRNEARMTINNWKSWYQEANGEHAPKVLFWGNGWYQIEGSPTKLRASWFDKAIDVLAERVQATQAK